MIKFNYDLFTEKIIVPCKTRTKLDIYISATVYYIFKNHVFMTF